MDSSLNDGSCFNSTSCVSNMSRKTAKVKIVRVTSHWFWLNKLIYVKHSRIFFKTWNPYKVDDKFHQEVQKHLHSPLFQISMKWYWTAQILLKFFIYIQQTRRDFHTLRHRERQAHCLTWSMIWILKSHRKGWCFCKLEKCFQQRLKYFQKV